VEESAGEQRRVWREVGAVRGKGKHPHAQRARVNFAAHRVRGRAAGTCSFYTKLRWFASLTSSCDRKLLPPDMLPSVHGLGFPSYFPQAGWA